MGPTVRNRVHKIWQPCVQTEPHGFLFWATRFLLLLSVLKISCGDCIIIKQRPTLLTQISFFFENLDGSNRVPLKITFLPEKISTDYFKLLLHQISKTTLLKFWKFHCKSKKEKRKKQKTKNLFFHSVVYQGNKKWSEHFNIYTWYIYRPKELLIGC